MKGVNLLNPSKSLIYLYQLSWAMRSKHLKKSHKYFVFVAVNANFLIVANSLLRMLCGDVFHLIPTHRLYL